MGRLEATDTAKPQAAPPAAAQPKAAAQPATATAAPASGLREALLLSVGLKNRLFLSRMLPSGKCIAYLSHSPRRGFVSTFPESNKGDDYSPTASPDGKLIAFYSTRSGAANLYLANADGTGQRALTDSEVSIQDFNASLESPIQFSPDSKRIAWLGQGKLWISDLEGQNQASFTEGGGVEAFAFSPDAKWIAYYQRGSIHRVAVSGQPDEVVVVNSADWPTLSWNPDPKKAEIYYFFKGLWKVDAQTRQKSLLASTYIYPNRARVAPKAGDSLAYVSLSQELRPEVTLAFPAKKTASGRAETQMITQGGGAAPFYSADGKTLFFERQGGLWSIGIGSDKVKSLQALPSFQAGAFMLDFALPVECTR